MQRVAPHVFRLTGLTMGNVYLITDPDGYTLIDTSIASSGPKILRQLAALGRPVSALKRILITHAHPDHVGGLPAVQGATGAQVYASSIERPVVEGHEPMVGPPPEKRVGLARYFVPKPQILPGTPVHHEVNDGDTLPEVLGGLQVIATPGHAPGHLSFWQPTQRILFCGDVMFHLFGVALPPSFFTVDMEQDKRSVQRIADLDPAIVCFGHGLPLVSNTAQRIRTFAQKVNAQS